MAEISDTPSSATCAPSRRATCSRYQRRRAAPRWRRAGVLVSRDQHRDRRGADRRPRAAVSVPRAQRRLPGADRAGRDHASASSTRSVRAADRLRDRPATGRWTQTPLEQLAGARHPARAAVRDRRARASCDVRRSSPTASRRSVPASRPGWRPSRRSQELGIEVVAVRVAAGRADRRGGEGAAAADPRGDPAARRRGDLPPPRAGGREGAGDRRERAANRIELARREEELVEQESRQPERSRRRPPTSARLPPRAGRRRSTWSRARSCGSTPSGRRSTPRCRPTCCCALALRELAGNLGQIEHLTITPDMLTPLLARTAA